MFSSTLLASLLLGWKVVNGQVCDDSVGTSWDAAACSADGSDYSYVETIDTSAGTRTIVTSHCPNHGDMVTLTPNYAINESTTYVLPLYPGWLSTQADWFSLVEQGASVGVMFNGAMVYSTYGGPTYGSLDATYANDYANSATFAEGYSFDAYGMHSSSSSEASYHAHVPPPVLLTQMGQTTTNFVQLGWAIDGYPVYGPRGPGGVMMMRCVEDNADATYCLDLCGGIQDNTNYDDGFGYRYHIIGTYTDSEDADEMCTNDMWTAQTSGYATDCAYDFAEQYYPYTPLCLRGCHDDITGVDSNIPDCSLSTLTGNSTLDTVAADVPNATAALAIVSLGCECDSPWDYTEPSCDHDSTTAAYTASNTTASAASAVGVTILSLAASLSVSLFM